MKANLLIGTPCFGGQVSVPYVRSLLNFQKACAGRSDVALDSAAQWVDSLRTRALQGLTAQFLARPPATHLLLVGAAVGFWPDQVFRLLESGADIAAAAVPRARRQGEPLPAGPDGLFDFEPVGPSAPARGGFVKARWAGTGLMLVKRRVLESMAEKYKDLRYRGEGVLNPGGQRAAGFALFNGRSGEDGRALGPEESFCRRWTDMGGEVWVDLESALKGVGPVVQGTAVYGSPGGAPRV